jgi:hypothetical protein
MANGTLTQHPVDPNNWARALTGMLEFQWWLFQVPFRAGLEMLERAATPTQPSDSAAPPAPNLVVESGKQDVKDLERYAVERARHGLAPPREIYESQYRDKIDWSQLPAWARALDPEVFEDSCHEG